MRTSESQKRPPRGLSEAPEWELNPRCTGGLGQQRVGCTLGGSCLANGLGSSPPSSRLDAQNPVSSGSKKNRLGFNVSPGNSEAENQPKIQKQNTDSAS